jgi:protein-disulfide isomerase-like protein with CxxC motif
MSDEQDDTLGDLGALEQSLAARLANIRREKAAIKRAQVESGAEPRRVTDHALIRYLERHKGIDVNACRDEMRSLADQAVPSKDGEHHWHASGVILIIGEEGQIITVLSPEQVEKWAGRKLANGERIPMAEGAA